VHVLGNSLGARIALELARRDRALSVAAIAASGLNMLPERVYQGVAMSTFRLLMYVPHPAIGPSGLLHRRPYFWRLLFWGILADVPTGLGNVRCPVILA
jgi:pimeloyl-ACP methyl ester carboxylesterase